MRLARRRFLQLAASAPALPALGRVAGAETYPSRPVRLLVGYAAGGVNDIVARLTGQMVYERLGQQFIIENRVGAGSNLATEAVVRASSDGYTLLEASTSNAWNATIYQNLKFDFIRDIAPVASTVKTYNVMLVHPSVLAKTVPEFIAYARANPGKINMGSAGSGSSPHLYGELFKAMTGVDMVPVHFRGDGPAIPELIAGRLQVMFGSVVTWAEQIKAGTVRASDGKASARQEARRQTSSTNSTARSMPGLPIPDSSRGLMIWARRRLQPRPPSLAGSSSTTPRNGQRSSAPPASRPNRPEILQIRFANSAGATSGLCYSRQR